MTSSNNNSSSPYKDFRESSEEIIEWSNDRAVQQQMPLRNIREHLSHVANFRGLDDSGLDRLSALMGSPTSSLEDRLIAEELGLSLLNPNFHQSKYVFYEKSALLLLMADHETLNPNPEAGCAYRDPVRCYGMKAMGYFPNTINTNDPSSVYPGIHCNSNIGDLRRLLKDMEATYPEDYPPYDKIIEDYIRTPDSWMRANVSKKFFTEVIPHLLSDDSKLTPGGSIILPNIPYNYEQVAEAWDYISPLAEQVRLLCDPMLNPLYAATELVKDDLERSSSNVSNRSALPVLLEYSNAPFIEIIKRADKDGDLYVDLTSSDQTLPFFSPVSKKRKSGTPQVEYIKRRSVDTSSAARIDLTQEESPSSSSDFQGRVSFSPEIYMID